MRDGMVGHEELVSAVGVAVEGEQATGIPRGRRQLEVEILPRGIAVELHGNAGLASALEHAWPVCNDTGAKVEHPTSRMAKDVNALP
jgi:hypothetical protein